jgi:hypothetical protein
MSNYEYHQLLKFLYFEGYANSYKEAEYILEDMSDEEFEELCERKLAHSFPLKPSERRSVENIRARLNDEEPRRSTRSGRKQEPTQEPKRKKRITDMSKVIVAHYLFGEGYAETLQGAEVMAENISEEWRDSIAEKFSLAADPSKPQSPKPTKLPRSREANVGKHDDWKDKPSTEWDDRPKKGKKLRSRASAVVGTQKRQDIETGVRK